MKDRRPLFVLGALLVILVVVVLLTRQSSGGDDVADDTTTTTAAVESTTTTTPLEPEWRRALNSIIAVQNEMLRNPDPSKVDRIVDPSCDCYKTMKDGVQTLKDRKWRVNGNTLDPAQVTLISTLNDQYRIAVVFKGTGAATVDAAGTVVEPGDTGLAQPVLYSLKRSLGGDWKMTENRAYEER
jgi:hypothetical protein